VPGDAGRPHLYVFAGLPGTGKSTLSMLLARRLGAAHLRIDTIEQALRELCGVSVGGEGYALAQRVAADNLRLGARVIADSCNPIERTRDDWERVATSCGAACTNVEVLCSDPVEHRRRIETRLVPGLRSSTWSEVEQREYHAWTRPRLVVDTAGRSEAQSFAELAALLGG
jgi:predicted kinase